MSRVTLAAAAVLCFIGWRLTHFWVDDAFIAFRYVAQAMAGHGYVWNAPPFRPVEGYSSPLWVWLLHLIWSLTGLQPPSVATWLGLGFGWTTIGLVGWHLTRRPWIAAWGARREVACALVLAIVVTNRSFLLWLSSGLETALWNSLVLAWAMAVWWARLERDGGSGAVRRWALITALSALVALARPEGLLFVAASVVLVGVESRRAEATLAALMAGLSPLVALVAHLGWRWSFYGEWLPNTYYAKLVRPWPWAGLRYLGAFLLEYGWWILAPLAIAALLRAWQGRSAPGRQDALFGQITVAASLGVYVAYLTLVAGGDHFEYRPLSVLVPFVALATLWIAERILQDRRASLALMSFVVVNALPIPWADWIATRDIANPADAELRRRPDPDVVPWPWRPVAMQWAEWQGQLAPRLVGLRQHEHRLLVDMQGAGSLEIAEGEALRWDGSRVLLGEAAGLLGWRDMRAAVIDFYGLSDWVVARLPSDWRYMAHERRAPPQYTMCYGLSLVQQEARVTPSQIRGCERQWRELVGRLPPTGGLLETLAGILSFAEE